MYFSEMPGVIKLLVVLESESLMALELQTLAITSVWVNI